MAFNDEHKIKDVPEFAPYFATPKDHETFLNNFLHLEENISS